MRSHPSPVIPLSVPSPLLTVTEVARSLKCHPRSIRRWIADGRLPVVRIGSAVRIKQVVLDTLVDGGGLA